MMQIKEFSGSVQVLHNPDPLIATSPHLALEHWYVTLKPKYGIVEPKVILKIIIVAENTF